MPYAVLATRLAIVGIVLYYVLKLRLTAYKSFAYGGGKVAALDFFTGVAVSFMLFLVVYAIANDATLAFLCNLHRRANRCIRS